MLHLHFVSNISSRVIALLRVLTCLGILHISYKRPEKGFPSSTSET
jgi:hypothetical protein